MAGELDMLTAPQLCPAVDRCLPEAEFGLLVVDLTEVMFLGSSDLKALLDVRDLTAERKVPLRLVAGDNRHVIPPLAGSVCRRPRE